MYSLVNFIVLPFLLESLLHLEQESPNIFLKGKVVFLTLQISGSSLLPLEHESRYRQTKTMETTCCNKNFIHKTDYNLPTGPEDTFVFGTRWSSGWVFFSLSHIISQFLPYYPLKKLIIFSLIDNAIFLYIAFSL
jgi:hypothetical protein